MQPADVPTPARVAARPRDARGYPVLAITPWADGEPRFAVTGTARIHICAVERRCSICGTPMDPGPVWRVVAGEEADAMAAAGPGYVNRAATVEPPGHRVCMLYAAVVCPWLARPNARRSADAAALGFEIERGAARGAGGAVAGFAETEFRLADVVMFRFAGLIEFRPHSLGEEHLGALTEAVAAEQRGCAMDDDFAICPPYLLADEDAAERRHAAYLAAARG